MKKLDFLEQVQPLIDNLKGEFTTALDKFLEHPPKGENIIPGSRELFLEMFYVQMHRYQQLYLLLNDMSFIRDDSTNVHMMTFQGQAPSSEGKRMLLPSVSIYDAELHVDYREAPVSLIRIEEPEIVTVGVVDARDGKVTQTGAKLLTTSSPETEIVFYHHHEESNEIVLIWGSYVENFLHDLYEKKDLN
jgi:hypothetical protein